MVVHYVGVGAFVFSLLAMVSAVTGWPPTRLGKVPNLELGAAAILMTFHFVVPLSDFVQTLFVASALILILLSFFGPRNW